MTGVGFMLAAAAFLVFKKKKKKSGTWGPLRDTVRLEQIALQRSLLAEIIPYNNFLDMLSGWPVSKVMADAWGHNRHHLWPSRDTVARTTLLHSSNGVIHPFSHGD